MHSDECVNKSLFGAKCSKKNRNQTKKKRQASPIAQIALFVFPTVTGRNSNTYTKCAAEGFDCKDLNFIGHVLQFTFVADSLLFCWFFFFLNLSSPQFSKSTFIN